MAQRKKESIASVAARLAQPLLTEMGLTLWDLRFEKEGSLWYLRYFIDKDGGVTIDDCENFSRAVEKKLDEADPIDQSYTLEVSSPGIERELTKDWHYKACLGQVISVRLIRPWYGVREFVGTLTNCGEDGVSIALTQSFAGSPPKHGDGPVMLFSPGMEITFQPSEAASVRLYYDYTLEESDDEGDQEDG